MANTQDSNQTMTAVTSTENVRTINGIVTENDEFLEYQRIGLINIPIILGVVLFIGIVGNCLVIYSIISKKYLRTLTNILILNLAVGDLVFLVICIPLATFRLIAAYWPFGDVGCKLTKYFTYVSLYVSIYTLVLMAISRYCAIIHPLSTIHMRTKRNIYIVIVILWIACLLGNVPALFQMKVYRLTTAYGEAWVCENSNHLTNTTQAKIYHVLFCVFGYFLPLAIISVLYGFILRNIFNANDSNVQNNGTCRQRIKKRVARMILLVVATFAICWFPLQLCMLTQRFEVWETDTETVNFFLAAKVVAYSNSCLNPILYTFVSSNFRKSFKAILCCVKTTEYTPCGL